MPALRVHCLHNRPPWGNILFAGVSYDPDTKQHTCRIEEWAQ